MCGDGDGDEIETVDMGAREFYRYPIGIDDTFEIASDEVLAIPGSDLTANDLHAPGMTLHVIAVTPPPGLPGTLDFDGETVTFTTPAGFVGEAWFDYTVESDSGNRGTGTVTVHVVPIPGDLNLDGQVTSRDLDIIRAWWGMEVEPGNLTKGDPSGDGLVGSADLDTVRANWGKDRCRGRTPRPRRPPPRLRPRRVVRSGGTGRRRPGCGFLRCLPHRQRRGGHVGPGARSDGIHAEDRSEIRRAPRRGGSDCDGDGSVECVRPLLHIFQ